MRSLTFTLILALSATLLAGLAGWRLKHGDLSVLLGAPPTQPGQRLYPDLDPAKVAGIRINTFGAKAAFEKTSNGWQATSPWRDRMDPNAATDIIAFTAGLRVEDFAPVEEVSLTGTGLSGQRVISIRLEDSRGRPLAKYRLGARTPWLAQGAVPESKSNTVFIQPVDKNRKSHVFVCAGDILAQFRNNLAFLRDHHPLFFHPALLREIQIKAKDGDLTLARDNPQAPWRIVKPLELPTNPRAVATLINNLGLLAAASVSDAPAAGQQPGNSERSITLASFNSPQPVTLNVLPPASPADPDTPATVSDRPGVVFMLPRKPERNLTSLADVHATVNSLRDPRLLHLNHHGLQTILIQPANSPDIEIKRDTPAAAQAPRNSEELEQLIASARWTTRVDGQEVQANSERIDALLNGVEKLRALSFESDAASDFSAWGLERPALRLSFLAWDGRAVNLRFGIGRDGRLFANRLGSASVIGVDPAFLSRVSVNPFEWKPSSPWDVSKVHVTTIRRNTPGRPVLDLHYNFVTERWTAQTDEGADVTPRVISARANHLLGGLEELTVARWLAPDDATTAAALESPSLILEITSKPDDDAPEEHRTLTLAPHPGSGYYCGRIAGEPYLFLISAASYERLSLDPLEKE